MTADYSSDIPRLRRTVGDLLALSAIQQAWVEKAPAAIAADLAELLIESLQMDFAFVRLCDPAVNHCTEVMRGSAWKAFPEWIQQHRAELGRISRKEIILNGGGADDSCRGLVIPIGVEGEPGFIAVASADADFPDQIDQQLLSVAANTAATAFRNAHLINELRNAKQMLREREQELRTARDELEIKVAERTSELRRSERELRDVVDTIPAIVWRALPDGSNAYVNRQFVEYAGMLAEHLAASGWHAATHPDDLPRHERKWRACVRTGGAFEDEVGFRRSDGRD